jgi:hypothetical protein
MNEDWTYRKIKCPPPPVDGRWVLTTVGMQQVECSDLAVLLRIMVDRLAQGYDTQIVFCRW